MINNLKDWWYENWQSLFPAVIVMVAFLIFLWVISGDTTYNIPPSTPPPPAVTETVVTEDGEESTTEENVPKNDGVTQQQGGVSTGG